MVKTMTTFKQKIVKDLCESGFFEEQALEVFERIAADPAQSSMRDRWNHNVEDYPVMISRILVLPMESHALNYIKEKMPNAWFRPIFDKELASSLGL